MKRIRLTRGRFALVDNADFDWLNQWKWCCWIGPNGTTYATRGVAEKGKIVTIRMHRLILGAPKGMEVDHVNHDGLDNRRANIRICTKSENQGNRRLQGGSSRFKGVCWAKRRRRWYAYISKNSHKHPIGYFKSEIGAALAYDNEAKKLHENFACLNFPEAGYV